MTDFHYPVIPSCASPIQDDFQNGRRGLIVSVPIPSLSPRESTDSSGNTGPQSPTKQTFTNVLLSSALQLPNLPETFTQNNGRLLSTRESLSLPVTTVNFRRFVARSGPIFWLQDRIEEIVLWRKGWKVTCAWMATYAFLCYFPKMFLLLPHGILISILLATHDHKKPLVMSASDAPKPGTETSTPKEGSAEWFVNLQGIQNLMGTVADGYDAVMPWVPLLTWNNPYTHNLLTVAVVSLVILTPIVIYLPLRPTLLLLGIGPLVITHPISMRILPAILDSGKRTLQATILKLVDDDNLLEKHWEAEKRYVELWEHERWTAALGWSKTTLKPNEKAWKSFDDWGEVVKSDAKCLVFALPSDWKFVETENWRVDLNGEPDVCDVDPNGWVYTDDNWQLPNPQPLDVWKTLGAMTRKRRWCRRIYRT